MATGFSRSVIFGRVASPVWTLISRPRSNKPHGKPKDPYRQTNADTYKGKAVQEWGDWDGYGPYKYRHHSYPNSGVLRDVNARRIFKSRAEETLRLESIIEAGDILPEEILKCARTERAALPPSALLGNLKRRCTLTGRPRGIFHQFRLSRFVFRHQADYNLLSGVQRAIWGKSIFLDP